MAKQIKAIYANGRIEFLEEPPGGTSEVLIFFPEESIENKDKIDFIPVGFGMWKDREEMKNSAKWVKELRKRWSLRKN